MNFKGMCRIDTIVNMKRSNFGMNYALPGVDDSIKLTIEVEANKKLEALLKLYYIYFQILILNSTRIFFIARNRIFFSTP